MSFFVQFLIAMILNGFSKTIKQKLWLYNEGDECINITGGWSSNSQALSSDTVAVTPNLTKNSSSMTASITATSSYYGGGTILPLNKINIDGFSKIFLTVTTSDSKEGWIRLVLLNNKTEYWGNPQKTFNLKGTYSNIMFDISDFQVDSYYIGFGIYSGNGTSSITVNQLYLK